MLDLSSVDMSAGLLLVRPVDDDLGAEFTVETADGQQPLKQGIIQTGADEGVEVFYPPHAVIYSLLRGDEKYDVVSQEHVTFYAPKP